MNTKRHWFKLSLQGIDNTIIALMIGLKKQLGLFHTYVEKNQQLPEVTSVKDEYVELANIIDL